MKIIHCCFGNEHYLDTWGYQQNLLPLYHAKLGHDVVVIASNDTFPKMAGSQLIQKIKEKGETYYNGPVRVKRIESFISFSIHLQIAKDLCKVLYDEAPDIIFFHGNLNLSLLSCISYKRKHRHMSLYVDSHADSFNTNSNVFYRLLYFRVFLTLFHKYAQIYVDKYFGVTIGRCRFLHDYFGIKYENIDLLPIGADVDAIESITPNRQEIRDKFNLLPDEIILVHGGKLDSRKGTLDLIDAFNRFKKISGLKLRLILFGKMEDQRIEKLINDDITCFEWLSRQEIFELFSVSSLAVWPIHHTTLIEDCIASNVPYLIRKTETTQHLINSNFYLLHGTAEEMYHKFQEYFLFEDYKEILKERVRDIRSVISYYSVAQRVLDYRLVSHNNKYMED